MLDPKILAAGLRAEAQNMLTLGEGFEALRLETLGLADEVEKIGRNSVQEREVVCSFNDGALLFEFTHIEDDIVMGYEEIDGERTVIRYTRDIFLGAVNDDIFQGGCVNRIVAELGGAIVIIFGGICGGGGEKNCEPSDTISQYLSEWKAALGVENRDNNQIVITQNYPGVPGHEVQPGETLSGIATDYDVSMNTIISANNIPDPDNIPAGTILVIPGHTDVGPTKKQLQADLAWAKLTDVPGYENLPITLIGWSAGGDTALLFADAHGGEVNIANIVMLGPTLHGEHTDAAGDIKWLKGNYPRIVINTLAQGTNINMVEDTSTGDNLQGMGTDDQTVLQELDAAESFEEQLIILGLDPDESLETQLIALGVDADRAQEIVNGIGDVGIFDYISAPELDIEIDGNVFQHFSNPPYDPNNPKPIGTGVNNNPYLIICMLEQLGFVVDPEWLKWVPEQE